MHNHTELLNYLATTFRLQSYLEIGLGDGVNFKAIKCEHKTGVDPEYKQQNCLVTTSDLFFEWNENESGFIKKFDLIFIDGLHHADQVKRDFENSLRCLNNHGFIVIHDTCPEKEEYTHVPRDSKIWNGDVYKFACSLISNDGIDFLTLEFDHGCTVVWKDASQIAIKRYKPVTNWQQFKKNKAYMNIISLQDFYEEMDLQQNIHQLS